jgi:2,4-dienoyl-CoA reductase-like NADH-dependent reductase (Old Yellow Enzyme family)/thioredoxin reductase
MAEIAAHPAYPLLFSEWKIRSTPIANRVVFAPTCPTWVADPYEGIFTDQAVAYYEERARGGCGLIIIGGTIIHPEALYSEFNFPGLWKDDQVEGLARVAEAVHRHGCKLACQLLHPGLRAMPVLKKDPAYDFDAEWYMVAPSQIPPGEYPNAPMPKELEEHEIQELLVAYAEAARRAVAAGLDGVEYHMSHGYLPWQFLSPLYNHRSDRWGGSYENRMRFPIESMTRVREAIGGDAFLGYRINSTSFWPGDLELEDVKQIVIDLEKAVDLDYVNLSAGVHHSYIHTPMTYEPGWERGYTKAVKEVSTKPVLLVGRITHPDVAEDILAADEADAILLARQLFADADWALKARDGQANDIRRCVAANYCWRSVIRGGRVQCVYNAEVGRERTWGRGTLEAVDDPKKVVVIGGGPAGLEYARIAAARGHHVVVLEREAETGGHVRTHSLLPGRKEYGQIGHWLLRQATGNGAEVRTGVDVDEAGLEALLAAERPDHVVVATGSRYREDGWQGQTAAPLTGAETGQCVSWDRVAKGDVRPEGSVLVVDDLQDANGPLTAVALADAGCTVRLVTRWPMLGMETIPEVYYLWIAEQLHRSAVEVVTDHFVKRIDGASVELLNVYVPDRVRVVEADWIVMSTGRQSLNDLYHRLRKRGQSVEMIGDAVAPRGTYEAVFEGHRQARKL